MRVPLFLISLMLSSAACSDEASYAEKAGVEPVGRDGGDQASRSPAKAHETTQETERFQFEYTWPAAAEAEAGLAAYLQKNSDSMLAGLREEADEDWSSAPTEDWTPRQHSASKDWKVVADIPGYLSLSGEMASYSGGAHGMYGVESLVWDRAAGKALRGIDLFQSPVALEQGLGQSLCATLNAEREQRRGAPIEDNGEGMFDNCPGLDEATVLVGSSNGKTFDRIAVYFGPYVAGPYAEGAYELDFPVSASVLDAVKPQYAEAFSVKG